MALLRLAAAQSSKLPYYRLKLGSVLEKQIDKCIYLDSDMLCLCDIREIFRY
ncbi:glycosyltransferase [Campylobacter coli]